MSEQPCAFHPDRLTRVSCSRCERPICTDDMFPAPVGIHCPVCAGKMRDGALGRTGYEMRARVERNPAARLLQRAQLTTLILVANVVVFLLMLGTRAPESPATLYRFGALIAPLPSSDWWRLFSSMFVHIGMIHLAFNMFALMMFGTPLEERYGKIRFLGLYLVSGLMGGAFTLAFRENSLSAGASGGIFGIMGALLAIALLNRAAMRDQLNSLLFLLGINLLIGLSGRVNLLAHLGGLVGGMVIAACLERAPRLRGNARTALVAGGYVVVLVVAVLLVSSNIVRL